VPIDLASAGDVGGLTFTLDFDTEWLRDPEFEWNPELTQASRQVNLEEQGKVHATLALPGTGLPGGTTRLGEASFRLRSVGTEQPTTVRVTPTDIADALGTKLVFGTESVHAQIRILARSIIGDNNANDRLDVGDATILQRLLSRLDIPRPWDVTGNDINGSQDLDSGDVIKALRVVVGLDPQPPGAAVSPQQDSVRRSGLSRHGPGETSGALNLLAERLALQSGEQLRLSVRLDQLSQRISGTTFTLRYPAAILRLVNAQSHQTGPMVPTAAITLWNVVTGYSNQVGSLSCAISSAEDWAATNGVLAVITFEIDPGFIGTSTSIEVTRVEVTSDRGFDTADLPGESLGLATALNIATGSIQPPRLTESGFEMTVAGPSGASRVVEVSTDLIRWDPVSTLTLTEGIARFEDTAARDQAWRFYRLRAP
jgi:hypothetical protein